MKHRGLAIFLGLAALATGAVAVAEAEDALLRRYPYDPACGWGRVGNGKGMVVRCLSEDEAKQLRAAPLPPAAGAKTSVSSTAAPAGASSKPTTPASTSSTTSTTSTTAGATTPAPATASASETEPESPSDAEPVTPTPGAEGLDVTVGPVTADEGTLGIGKLGAPKDRYLACVQKNGGLSGGAKTGEVSVRFLVRGKGIAEGVSVSKRQNLSKEAAQCVADVVDRRRVGTPEAQLVGATLLVKFVKVEK